MKSPRIVTSLVVVLALGLVSQAALAQQAPGVAPTPAIGPAPVLEPEPTPVPAPQPGAVPAQATPPAYPPAPPPYQPPQPQANGYAEYEQAPVASYPSEPPPPPRGRRHRKVYISGQTLEPGMRPPLRYRYIEGTPLPEGYHLEERASRGLIGGGVAMFAVPYLVGAFGAISLQGEGSSGWLGIPLVGPWLALGQRRSDCGEIGEPSPGGFDCFVDQVGSGLLVTSGVMQALGVGMVTLGVLHTRTYAVADYAKVQLAPMTTAGGGGLLLRGTM